MTIFLVTIHIIVCLLLTILVLMQAGKGSSIGAALGGGGANTLFGPSGSGNILSKITTGLAIVFMITSISLAYISDGKRTSSVIDKIKTTTAQTSSATDNSSNTSGEKTSE